MIKIIRLDKINAVAEVEVPLELVLPDYEANHKKTPLQQLKENPETMREIKRLERRGDPTKLAALIERKLTALNYG